MSVSEEKIANPLNFYKKPSDVAHDTTLSLEEKIKTLDNWLNDIELREVADEENMLPMDQERHQEVDFLRRLLRTYRTHQKHTKERHH